MSPFSSRPPAFQFYSDDFYAAVRGTLSLAETGAYILLPCYQWTHGEIPREKARLRRVVGGAVNDTVLAKFPVGPDGRRRNLGLESVREKQAEFTKAFLNIRS